MPQTSFYAPVATNGHGITLVKTMDRLLLMPAGALLRVTGKHYFTVSITVYNALNDSVSVTCAYENRTAEEAEQLKDMALREGWKIW